MKSREVADTDLVIKFPTKEMAEQFASWLCNSGEQDYWYWMEAGDKNTVRFHYHGEEDQSKDVTDPNRYGKFMADLTIRTTAYSK